MLLVSYWQRVSSFHLTVSRQLDSYKGFCLLITGHLIFINGSQISLNLHLEHMLLTNVQYAMYTYFT